MSKDIEEKVHKNDIAINRQELQIEQLKDSIDSLEKKLSSYSSQVEEHERYIEARRRAAKIFSNNFVRIPIFMTAIWAVLSFSNWVYDLQTLQKDKNHRSYSDYLTIKK